MPSPNLLHPSAGQMAMQKSTALRPVPMAVGLLADGHYGGVNNARAGKATTRSAGAMADLRRLHVGTANRDSCAFFAVQPFSYVSARL